MPFQFRALRAQDDLRAHEGGCVDVRHPSECLIISGPIQSHGWPAPPYTLLLRTSTLLVTPEGDVIRVSEQPAYALDTRGRVSLCERAA